MGGLNGMKYVRFATHEGARACIEAQTSAVNSGESDVLVHWSESERAVQGVDSIYGDDMHNAFLPSALDVIRKAVNIQSLWVLSERHQSKDTSAPKPKARQLHFIADCSNDQFMNLCDCLEKALCAFHQQVTSKHEKKHQYNHSHVRPQEGGGDGSNNGQSGEGHIHVSPQLAWPLEQCKASGSSSNDCSSDNVGTCATAAVDGNGKHLVVQNKDSSIQEIIKTGELLLKEAQQLVEKEAPQKKNI